MSEPITRPERPLVLVACMAAMFMASVEATIVTTAMPTIIARLGGFSLYGWVFAAFLLPQAVTVPIYGRLADLYGRKPVFQAGAAIFLVGSLLCGLAPNIVVLVLSRALQGLGGGGVVPIAQTIVADIYPARDRPRVQGYFATIWGVSALVGPLIGALIVQHLVWQLVFWINLPIGLAAMALLGRYLVEAPRSRSRSLDIKGAVLTVVSAGTLILALLQADSLGWWSLPLIAFAVLVGLLLVRQERATPEPMLPVALWRQRTVAVGTVGSLVTGALLMGISAYVPTYVQGVMGRSPQVTGLVVSFLLVGWPLGSMVGGRLMLRTSYRLTARLGSAGLVAGAALLLLMRPGGGLAVPCGGAGVLGIGMGLSSMTFLISAQEAASWDLRGAATSSIVFMRTLGQSFGTAILGGVLNLGLALRLPPGGADPVQLLMDPTRRGTLPATQSQPLVEAVAGSLHAVYVTATIIALIALAVAWRIPAGLRPGTGE